MSKKVKVIDVTIEVCPTHQKIKRGKWIGYKLMMEQLIYLTHDDDDINFEEKKKHLDIDMVFTQCPECKKYQKLYKDVAKIAKKSGELKKQKKILNQMKEIDGC